MRGQGRLLRQGLRYDLGRVVLPPALRHGPVHDHADALPDAARGLRLGEPYGLQHGQHVGRRQIGDALPTHAGEGVGLEGGDELRRMLGVPPRRPVVLIDRARRFLERQHGLGLALGLERVATLPRHAPVLQRQLARLGQRDQAGGAEAELGPPAADHDALHPAPRAR